MGRERGIALINALIMVAAISAVASGLLLKAENSRMRLIMLQEGAQVELYLDAAEQLLPLVLERDWEDDPDIDHRGEIWANENYAMSIDRGVVHGALFDLQGRFNINWLSDPEDRAARAAFDRLIAALGLPSPLANAIAGYVAPTGPANAANYANRAIAVVPASKPLQILEEVRLVDGMTDGFYRRLLPFIAALPVETVLNCNTASIEVLAAFVPAASRAALRRMINRRKSNPFSSVGDFRNRAEAEIHEGVFDNVDLGRFGVSSSWFTATLEASLMDMQHSRRVVVYRAPNEGVARVTIRVPGD